MTEHREGGPARGARWADPIAAADRAWTRFETWLAVLVLGLEVLSMSLWVALKGFSGSPDSPAGSVFRAVALGTVLGVIAYATLGRRSPALRSGVTVAAALAGAVASRAFATVGVDYASNLLNWYQQACFLTLLGGLRGVGTRLTMLLALLGGSLATARGRHIVIDIVTRFVSHRRRVAMTLVAWFATAIVCFVTAWGFFDHISIENFGAAANDPAAAKIVQVGRRLGEDFFIARKQVELDLKSTPHVLLRGEIYSSFLTGAEWNAWLDSAGFAERYGKDATDALKLPVDSVRAPLVVVPGRGEPRGELINAAYLVFPIGFLVIALRFLVRGLLVISGHEAVEVDESEDWGEAASLPDGSPTRGRET